MKTLFTLLATLCLLAASAEAQVIKSLGYNTTNGQVVYSSTNALTFTNEASFQTINANSIKGLGNDAITLDEEPKVLSGNWAVYGALSFETTTNAAVTRTNLGLYATNAAVVSYAQGLFDGANDEPSMRVEDGYIGFSSATINTNAPTDTTNAVRWIDVNVLGDTNIYKLPLYQ